MTLSDIRAYLLEQQSLVAAFYRAFPQATDHKLLLDYPASGTLLVAGAEWGFKKHGAGVRFERTHPPPHVVVEAHNRIDRSDLFDLWRMESYLQSVGNAASRSALESDIKRLIAEGAVLPESKHFKLAP